MESRPPGTPPTRPLVLFIEGHIDTRALYSLALSAMGFDVVAARDGDDAYRRAWDAHPDIVVTDLAMPGYDAWRFLQDLKDDPDTRDIPVVAVTGHVEQSIRERAERDGFAAFVPKPCPPDTLALELRRVLDGHVHE